MRERRRAAQKRLAELRYPELTNEEEWQQWRDFIGSKRTCEVCGLVMGDPEKHAAWHENAA